MAEGGSSLPEIETLTEKLSLTDSNSSSVFPRRESGQQQQQRRRTPAANQQSRCNQRQQQSRQGERQELNLELRYQPKKPLQQQQQPLQQPQQQQQPLQQPQQHHYQRRPQQQKPQRPQQRPQEQHSSADCGLPQHPRLPPQQQSPPPQVSSGRFVQPPIQPQRQHHNPRLSQSGNSGSVVSAKASIRSFVWSMMESNQLIQSYPPTCHDRIPNFIGCRRAAERLANTREFRDAAVVKVNPSLAQMPLRFLILDAGKKLLVPTPALTDDAFMYSVDPSTFAHSWQKKRASSKKGAQELGSALSVDQLSDLRESGFKIDLYVVAAVAVCRNGVRLGKGRGFAELEWAILHQFGLVDADTLVATTVHEAQLLDEVSLHPGLMESHDLPVDLIVTPNRIVNARRRRGKGNDGDGGRDDGGDGGGGGDGVVVKPEKGILWDKVTEEMLAEIPILKRLREMSVKEIF